MATHVDRDEFEQWAEHEGYRLMRRGDAYPYLSDLTESAWRGWSAARQAT